MDPFALPTFLTTILTDLNEIIGNLMSMVSAIEIIGIIIIIGKCLFAAFNLIWSLLQWFWYFLIWLFTPWPKHFMTPHVGDDQVQAGFICWLIRYIIVIFYKISALPKCFLWYFLDTAGWVLYLPFRFIFWLIDWILGMKTLQENERAGWRFLDEIDYFLHGRPKDNYFIYQYDPKDPNVDGEGKPLVNGDDPETLNLGFHLIHFPDSVMRQCYSIMPFALKSGPNFPIDALTAFMECVMNPF
jgi:hypothetical protein